MNEQIRAGADIHAGDGGYSIGNRAEYEAFVSKRNQSLREYRTDTSGKWVRTEDVEQLVEVYREQLECARLLAARECMGIAQHYDFPKLSGPGTIITNRIFAHFFEEE